MKKKSLNIKKIATELWTYLETAYKPKSVNKTEEFHLTQKMQFTKINKQESE